MSDLPSRLRSAVQGDVFESHAVLMIEAADEIERLEAERAAFISVAAIEVERLLEAHVAEAVAEMSRHVTQLTEALRAERARARELRSRATDWDLP